MTLTRTGLLVSLVVFCSAMYLLVTGSTLLNYPISESAGLPLGTLITWFGFLSLPGILYFGFPALRDPKGRTEQSLRFAWLISFLLAVAWPFISYYLAANWSYSFKFQPEFRGSDRASEYFWLLAEITVVLPLLILLSLFLVRIFRNRKG
jgi:hypothetical protein